MGATVQFETDAGATAYTRNLTGIAAGAEAAVKFVVNGFLPTDRVDACYWTAKINVGDADSAPTNIQKFVALDSGEASPGCSFLPTSASATARKAIIFLDAIDTNALLTARTYGFSVVVERDGRTYNRVLVTGMIQSELSVVQGELSEIVVEFTLPAPAVAMTGTLDFAELIRPSDTPLAVAITMGAQGFAIPSIAVKESRSVALTGGQKFTTSTLAVSTPSEAVSETVGQAFGESVAVLTGKRGVSITGDNGIFLNLRPDGISITDPLYGGTFTRATTAYQLGLNGVWTSVASGAERCNHFQFGTTLGRLYEIQRTNSALGSCTLNAGTYWSGYNTGYTPATATSNISGQTAELLTGLGAIVPTRFQTVGVFVNGQTDCVHFHIQPGTATTSLVGIRDGTAGAFLCQYQITWSTLAITAIFAGANAGVIALGNGWYDFWVTATGTAAGTGAAGNTRQAYLYPLGSAANTMTATWSYGALEANASYPTSPIVTVASTVTRNIDIGYVPLPAAAVGIQVSMYAKFNSLAQTITSNYLYPWSLGDTYSTGPFWCGGSNASKAPRPIYNNGTDASVLATQAGAAPLATDIVETRDVLNTNGSTLGNFAVNGGTENVGTVSATPAHGLITPFNVARIYIGGTGSGGGQQIVVQNLILARATPTLANFQNWALYLNIQPGVPIAFYGGSCTRATTAYQFSKATGLYTSVANNVSRHLHDVYSTGLSAWVLATRLAGEPQRTNSALGSNLFSNNTYWAGNTSYTITSALSCISGQTAWKHTNLNAASSRSRTQTAGTFVNGQTDCVYFIVENDVANPAATATVTIFDNTASAVLGGITMTWATLALSTFIAAPTASGVQNLGTGPNGGQMVLLWMTATGTASGTGAAGNTRVPTCYVTGVPQNGFATVVHHAQFEANAPFPTTPIVTTSAAVTRNAEIVSVPLPPAAQGAQALCVYEKIVLTGLGHQSNMVRWLIGTQGLSPTWLGYSFGASTDPRGDYSNGTDAIVVSTAPTIGATDGDVLEVRDLLLLSGAVNSGGAKNGTAETLGIASAAPVHGIIVPWNANTAYLGSSGNIAQGGASIAEFILAAGAPSMATFRTYG